MIPRDQCVITVVSGGEKGLCIVGLVRSSYLAIRISCFVARELVRSSSEVHRNGRDLTRVACMRATVFALREAVE